MADRLCRDHFGIDTAQGHISCKFPAATCPFCRAERAERECAAKDEEIKRLTRKVVSLERAITETGRADSERMRAALGAKEDK
jgi:hypothetical protein